MKTILSGLILFTFATVIPAQSGKKVIFWSGDPGCGLKSRRVTNPETVRCGQIKTERGPVNTISYNGMSLGVAFLTDDDRLIVGAHITNSTDSVIGFDGDLWGAAHFKTRAGYYAGEQPIAAETSIPSRDIIRTMARGVRNENVAADTVADMQMTTESRRVRLADGTERIRTTIVADKSAKEAEERQRINRAENLSNEQRRLRSTALTAKSVPAMGSIRGLVYFHRFKEAEFVLYLLRVEDTTFVFQIPKMKK